MPARVQTPAMPPKSSALKWYMPSEIPTASVQSSGITRPPTWPMKTTRMPKWKSGDPIRSSRDS